MPRRCAIEPSLARIVSRGALRTVPSLLIYASVFTALHHVAAQFAAGNLFSLWFPAAGLRFAFIRVRGTNTAELEPAADARGEDPWSDLWFYANPIFVSMKR